MAEVTDESLCRFDWHIGNPFVPWSRFDAIFYHGSGTPFLTEWKASIVPFYDPQTETRSFITWPFVFTLECLSVGNREFFYVEKLTVEILANEKWVARRELPGYAFSEENRYLFEIHATTSIFPTMRTINLNISVLISLPKSHVVLKGKNELIFRSMDLVQLSLDLKKLRMDRNNYTNLSVRSKGSASSMLAHSYIVKARLGDLFIQHIHEGRGEIGISEGLLVDLLNYVYSGLIKTTPWPSGGESMNELCQVMDMYRLNHLYKHFVQYDSRQERFTVQKGNKNSIEIHLNDHKLAGRSITNPKYTWHVLPNSSLYEFVLDIQFNLNPSNPNFCYNLQSRSPRKMFAQLTVAFVCRSEVREDFEPIHEADFELSPYETLDCASVNFEGRRRLLDGFQKILHAYPTREAQYTIRCILSLGTGTTIERLCLNEGDYNTRDKMTPLHVLSDHMSEVLKRDHDFKVVCRGENGLETHLLHKAIFVARVPEWREVLEDCGGARHLPNRAKCVLSSESFRYVLQYMYTGKVFRIPEELHDEIIEFAVVGKFASLRSLVDGMRSEARKNRFYQPIPVKEN